MEKKLLLLSLLFSGFVFAQGDTQETVVLDSSDSDSSLSEDYAHTPLQRRNAMAPAQEGYVEIGPVDRDFNLRRYMEEHGERVRRDNGLNDDGSPIKFTSGQVDVKDDEPIR